MPDANGNETEDEARERARAVFASQAVPTADLNAMRAAGVTPLGGPEDATLPAFAQPAPPTTVPASDQPPPTPAVQPEAPPPVVVPPPAVPAPVPARPHGAGGGPPPTNLESDLNRAIVEKGTAAKGETDAAVAVANKQAEVADAAAKAHADDQVQLAARKQATEAEAARLSHQADAEDQKYKSMGFTNFWTHASILGKPNTVTGARILGALSMALGAAGASLTKAPNYAMELINKRIEEDYQRQRDSIMKQRDVVSEARGRAKDAKAEQLLALENWRKNAYELTEAQGKAMLAKMGPQAETAKGATVLADIHEKAVESKEALAKGQAMISNTRADTALKGAEIGKVNAEAAKDRAAAAAAGGGKPPSIRDTEEFSRLETDAQKIEQAKRMIMANPQAWEEVRKNSLDWKRKEAASKNAPSLVGATRGVLQGVGLANVEERQGLKSEAAKALAPLIFDTQTSIAKGYGPIITKAHKELAEKSAQWGNLSAKEMVRQLQAAQDGLTSQRDAVLSNRKINDAPSGERTPITPGNPGGGRPTLSAADRLQLQVFVSRHPNDPRAEQARALLRQ